MASPSLGVAVGRAWRSQVDSRPSDMNELGLLWVKTGKFRGEQLPPVHLRQRTTDLRIQEYTP